ncbi:hypothetical protein BKA81DRAFT_225 [Phyllosticta paracitricarpa]|uniref:Uncharacterized protein n=1 Tax=Phyllosticta citricarpa TaxID=55181 RepID=A0ABR1MKJ9_9PEZI
MSLSLSMSMSMSSHVLSCPILSCPVLPPIAAQRPRPWISRLKSVPLSSAGLSVVFFLRLTNPRTVPHSLHPRALTGDHDALQVGSPCPAPTATATATATVEQFQ